ncbi:MAG: hypothetical protein Q9170_006000 [Blastenia crenularia]
MATEMRSIVPAADTSVASFTGGSLYDLRLPDTSRARLGPSKTISDFHRYKRRGVETHQEEEIKELIRMHEEAWPICFTYADLSSQNILVREDAVAGIVDWATAGWYPSYWEYTSASKVNPQNEFWRNEVDKFLEPMAKELAMGPVRVKYSGDGGSDRLANITFQSSATFFAQRVALEPSRDQLLCGQQVKDRGLASIELALLRLPINVMLSLLSFDVS